MIYDSPLYTPEENLQVAIGEIEHRDKIIKNLREQIKNLRELASDHGVFDSKIDEYQFKHIVEKLYESLK